VQLEGWLLSPLLQWSGHDAQAQIGDIGRK
jgi:hypothetical protein